MIKVKVYKNLKKDKDIQDYKTRVFKITRQEK